MTAYHIPIRATLFFLAVLTALLLGGPARSEQRQDEEYLMHKKTGSPAEALAALEKMTLSLTEPASIEVALFRIQELLLYPELYERGIEVLNRIAAGPGSQEWYLIDRIDHIRTWLYLSRGDIKSAATAQKGLSFLDFLAMGPFTNRSAEDFERTFPPEKAFNRSQVCPGMFSPVSWFPATPDRSGIINFNDLYPSTANAFFYLTRAINIQATGEYVLILGKTGYTDLWLDGQRLYTDRGEHGFCHDQYYIRVHLQAGPHRLVIKAGSSEEGIRISLRLASAGGMRINPGPDNPDASAEPAVLRGIAYFPALAGLLKIKDPGPEELFSAGYLFFAARLCGHDNNRGIDFFSAIPEGHPLYSTACLYMAAAQKETEAKERYLNRSIQADPGNLESLRELAGIKISHSFPYEAFPLIQRIGNSRPHSPWHHESMARLFMKLEWLHEARRHAAALKRSPYPSSGQRLESSLYLMEKDHHRAIPVLKELARIDAFNLSVRLTLADCYEKTGDYSAAEELLISTIALHPNNSSLKLRAAGIAELRDGPERSLPYLAAALKAAPGNKDIVKALGIAFHKLGKKELAVYYLSLARGYDPGNHQLSQYLETIQGETDGIERYALKDDMNSLAAPAMKYRNEPAVILLDETTIAVKADGSYELRVRKVVMVNASEEVLNFGTRYIVLDPDTETAESISCSVVRESVRTEITGRYRKSLSRPDSSLYYRLDALVIPVPSLAPGDILDLSYVIRNRGGAENRHYFGHRITAGDTYRTMRFRAVLTHPGGTPVYCRLKGINERYLAREKRNHGSVYRMALDNLEPLKEERAMPDRSEVLPAVYFTSHRSWDDFYAWYRSLLKNRIRTDAEMKEAVRSVAAANKDPLDRVRAIYCLVTGSIRYTGFEFGLGGIRPRDTDATYHSKMGDCKDMSLLLVALLREAGIDARLSLVRTRDRGRANLAVPLAGEFNHALCYINLEGGFFLDPTAPDTGIRELPADDRDVDAFVLDDRGWKFINTGSGFYLRNLAEIAGTVTLKPDGNAEAERSLVKQGEPAPAARTALKDPAKQSRRLTEYWNSYFPGSAINGLEIASSKIDEPVRYSYRISIPGFSRSIGSSILFNASLTRSDLYQSYALPGSRLTPVILSGTGRTRTATTFAIPHGYRVDLLPGNEQFDGGSFTARFSYSAGAGTITVESIIEIKAASVGTGEYARFREFARFVDRKERERIVLSPASP